MSIIDKIEEIGSTTNEEFVEKYHDEIAKKFVKYNVCFTIYHEIIEYRNFKYNFYATIQVRKENDKFVPDDDFVTLSVDCTDFELEEKLSLFYDIYDYMYYFVDGCTIKNYNYLKQSIEKDIDRFLDKTLSHIDERIEKLKEERAFYESKIKELK